MIDHKSDPTRLGEIFSLISQHKIKISQLEKNRIEIALRIINFGEEDFESFRAYITTAPNQKLHNEIRFSIFAQLPDIVRNKPEWKNNVNLLIYSYLMSCHPGRSGSALEAAYFFSWEFQDETIIPPLLEILSNGRSLAGKKAVLNGLFYFYFHRNNLHKLEELLNTLQRSKQVRLPRRDILRTLSKIKNEMNLN